MTLCDATAAVVSNGSHKNSPKSGELLMRVGDPADIKSVISGQFPSL